MRSFLGFGSVAYKGVPSTRAIKLGGIAAQVVPLLFQWSDYGASSSVSNINVILDIDNSACKALDQIRSIYIDNLGSDNPVYAFFPDTSYCVVAKPNSEGWYPVYTNAKKFQIIGEGFLTGHIPVTSVIVANVALEANVNNEIDNAVALWRASPTISGGNSLYNSALGTPALGDQLNAAESFQLVVGNTVSLWNSPASGGFLYITSLVVSVFNASNPVNVNASVIIESTGISGSLARPVFLVTTVQQPGVQDILRLTGMQLKLDATQSWRARVVTGCVTGEFQVFSSYTYQPNN